VVNRVVKDVQAQTGGRVGVAIVGAKGEEPLGQAIADQIKTRTVVCSGQTTVRELMALVKRCQLFLTNDTGPMHVAAAFKVPLVAVFGPTDWQTTSP
ncbi:MAG TPA: lipopolysaccharide heptosyltransferase II, partial [Nitrospira sp.]|nr:lipopolysaccharide heptosyltransferase II [Nitrospira sp.]